MTSDPLFEAFIVLLVVMGTIDLVIYATMALRLIARAIVRWFEPHPSELRVRALIESVRSDDV
jgi:hypothetical protein